MLVSKDDSLFDKSIRMIINKSMKCLLNDEDEKALYLLRKADKWVRKRPTYNQYAIVSNLYNNMSLVLRRNNFLELAKEYLMKAKSINFRYKLDSGLTDMNYGTLAI